MSKKTAIVTGANSGVGFETAKALSGMDYQVVMACRNQQKAEAAQQQITEQIANADLLILPLDVSEPASIHNFVKQFSEQVGELDLLINNAGIVGKALERNSAGHEMQMATNYFGMFLLTGLLLPLFRQDVPTRIVNVGSLSHRFGKLALEDFNWESTPYNGWRGYARSKVATMAYTLELARRLKKAHSNTIALSAHPGFASTDIAHKTGAISNKGRFQAWIEKRTSHLIPTPTEAARPILLAATSDEVQCGDYYGPGGFLEIAGTPARAKIKRAALKPEKGAKLWKLSEAMTGIRYLS